MSAVWRISSPSQTCSKFMVGFKGETGDFWSRCFTPTGMVWPNRIILVGPGLSKDEAQLRKGKNHEGFSPVARYKRREVALSHAHARRGEMGNDQTGYNNIRKRVMRHDISDCVYLAAVHRNNRYINPFGCVRLTRAPIIGV